MDDGYCSEVNTNMGWTLSTVLLRSVLAMFVFRCISVLGKFISVHHFNILSLPKAPYGRHVWLFYL